LYGLLKLKLRPVSSADSKAMMSKSGFNTQAKFSAAAEVKFISINEAGNSAPVICYNN